MSKSPEADTAEWSFSATERDRLVHLCYRLTGDPGTAEDLAQETLVRAWQHRDQLRDSERRDAWLKAIARNVCRRWFRDRKPSFSHLPMPAVEDWPEANGDAEPADNFDLEIELERGELTDLLDRAMGLLPPETRRVLIERYVEELPQAETARRLGLTEGAVAMRLQRGKLALRRVLVTTFQDQAAVYGLGTGEASDGWQATTIWCPRCGQSRMDGIFVRNLGVFRLHCPRCGKLNDTWNPALFASVAGYQAALTRLLEWGDWLYKHSLRNAMVSCPRCGSPLAIRKDVSGGVRVLSYYCSRCRGGTWNGQVFNLLALPQTRRFWQDHPRMCALPEREIEADGRAAVVAGFESVTDRGRLEIIYARDTLGLIAIHANGKPV